MYKSISMIAALVSLFLMTGSLQAQSVSQLRCGQNVNCNDRNSVLNAMASAHSFMSRSGSPTVRAYQGICADAYYRVSNLNAAIPFNAGIAQPQLDACNAGLYEMGR